MAIKQLAKLKKDKAFTYLYEDLPLTAVEHTAIRTMASIAIDPREKQKYPKPADMARKVGLTLERYNILRMTPEYQRALKGAIRLAAMEAQAEAIPGIKEMAAAGDPEMDSVQAFRALAQVAGTDSEAKQAPGVVQQNNFYSLEDRLLGRVKDRLSELGPKIVDVEVE